MRYGDCPICGKGIVYEGGEYCSPDCWSYASPTYPQDRPRKEPMAEQKPKQPMEAAPPPKPIAIAKRWEPVLKKKKVDPAPPVLPDLGAEEDVMSFLAGLE